MSDPLEKVTAEEPLVLRADTWNAFIDAAKFVRDRFGGQRDGPQNKNDPLVPAALVYIKNTIGGSLLAHSPVVPSGATPIDPTVYPLGARRQPVFEVAAPGSDTDLVFITQGPIDSGKLGLAATAGVTVAAVNVSNDTHRFARPVPGNYIALESAETGPVKILGPFDTGNATRLVQLTNSIPTASTGELIGEVTAFVSGVNNYTVKRKSFNSLGTMIDYAPQTIFTHCRAVPLPSAGLPTVLPIGTIVTVNPIPEGSPTGRYEITPASFATKTNPGFVSTGPQILGQGTKTVHSLLVGSAYASGQPPGGADGSITATGAIYGGTVCGLGGSNFQAAYTLPESGLPGYLPVVPAGLPSPMPTTGVRPVITLTGGQGEGAATLQIIVCPGQFNTVWFDRGADVWMIPGNGGDLFGRVGGRMILAGRYAIYEPSRDINNSPTATVYTGETANVNGLNFHGGLFTGGTFQLNGGGF